MGWLLGCFKCAGDPQQVKPKKQSSGVVNLVSGRANSAAVAHASSPDDLHRVRKSPSNSAVDNSNRNGETGNVGHPSTLLSSFRPQAKKNEGANLGSTAIEANKLNRERHLNRKLEDELESFKDRLVQKADTTQQLGDQVNDFRTNHSSEPLPNFKVQLNKSERDTSGQVQQSSMMSPLVTRGRLRETHSIPSSPFSGLHGHGSSYGGGVQASKIADFNDELGISNALKRPELNFFRVKSGLSDEHYKTEAAPSGCEVQSPPWLFSDAKLDTTNHNAPHIFESSDLLLEHLDVSSLIEDSALITNWERSSGELCFEQQGLSAKLPSVRSQRGVKSLQHSGHKNQMHRQKIVDGDFSDCSSSCSMVAFELASEDDGAGLLTQSIVGGEGGVSSNGMPSEAQVLSCDKEFIYAISNMSSDAKAPLLQTECFTDIEESENESSPHSCFASQFRLSKRLWSSTRTPFERDPSTADFSHGNGSDADEVLLPCTHPNMHLLHESKDFEDERHPLLKASTESSEKRCTNTRVDCKECAGVHVDDHLRSSPQLQQESVEGFAFNGVLADSSMVSSLTDEEDGEQRKKLRLEDSSSSSDRVQGSMQIAEDEQTRLLNAAALGDHGKSLEAQMDTSVAPERSALEQLSEESSYPQASDRLSASPSSSDAQTAIASHQSPARLALADDRPIIGTVAAHWSPVTPKKWWDGKGIPNSTNKYQEDQKVNWHAVPFEVRLEQALAKQDTPL